jgi:hypothetical protein
VGETLPPDGLGDLGQSPMERERVMSAVRPQTDLDRNARDVR